MQKRHEVYNETLTFIEKLETDTQKLETVYRQVHEEIEHIYEQLDVFLKA